jgi:hypothetical protein
MIALGVPALNRWESSPEHRDLAKKRSMEVIEKPWDTELSPSGILVSLAFSATSSTRSTSAFSPAKH